jgi:hypothetical protein
MLYFKRAHTNMNFLTWFKRWLASFIKDQIDGGASEINLNIFIGTYHENLCTWLFESWREVKSHIDMIVKGWERVDC